MSTYVASRWNVGDIVEDAVEDLSIPLDTEQQKEAFTTTVNRWGGAKTKTTGLIEATGIPYAAVCKVHAYVHVYLYVLFSLYVCIHMHIHACQPLPPQSTTESPRHQHSQSTGPSTGVNTGLWPLGGLACARIRAISAFMQRWFTSS